MIWLRLIWTLLICIYALFLVSVIYCSNIRDNSDKHKGKINFQATVKTYNTKEINVANKNADACVICLEEFTNG